MPSRLLTRRFVPLHGPHCLKLVLTLQMLEKSLLESDPEVADIMVRASRYQKDPS